MKKTTMIHFIFWGIVLIFILLNQMEKVKIEKEKEAEEKLMKDLKYLQKQLLMETDPIKRTAIIKRIELISSLYN
jgi:large-conductance mechanosensitive channel